MRSNPFPSIPPFYGSPGRDPGSRGARAFLGVFYAPRGRLALGGFEVGDHDDSIDFEEFLRLLYDSDDSDEFDELVEYHDNQRW